MLGSLLLLIWMEYVYIFKFSQQANKETYSHPLVQQPSGPHPAASDRCRRWWPEVVGKKPAVEKEGEMLPETEDCLNKADTGQ